MGHQTRAGKWRSISSSPLLQQLPLLCWGQFSGKIKEQKYSYIYVTYWLVIFLKVHYHWQRIIENFLFIVHPVNRDRYKLRSYRIWEEKGTLVVIKSNNPPSSAFSHAALIGSPPVKRGLHPSYVIWGPSEWQFNCTLFCWLRKVICCGTYCPELWSKGRKSR